MAEELLNQEQGVWLKLWRVFLKELDEQGTLNWYSSMAVSHSSQRGLCVGKTKRGKGSKWMMAVDGVGVPIGSQITSASPAEIKLAESTLEQIRVPRVGKGHTRK